MRVRFLFLLTSLLLAAAPARAQDTGKPMANLLKQPAYVSAWKTMMAGAAAPFWIHEYAKTLDGPPTPVLPVELFGETSDLVAGQAEPAHQRRDYGRSQEVDPVERGCRGASVC
jgi:hypothetical protein